jgi:hypothetical protein
MTTAKSPLRVVKNQADRIAAALKAAERGETIAHDPGGKIAAARSRDQVKFAIAMDDKIVSIEMPWATIRATSEVALSEYIVKQMRGVSAQEHH